MQYKKSKTMLAVAAIILILLLLGMFFVFGINNILTEYVQDGLQKSSEHISGSVSNGIKGNFDTLSALAKQNILTKPNQNTEDKVKILDTEAKRKGLLFLAYADTKGCALTNKSQTLWFTDYQFYKNALIGSNSVSDEFINIPGIKEQIIAYAVPVTKSNKTIGVLISAVKNNGKLKLADNTAVNLVGSVYLLSKEGKIISSYNGEYESGDFFKYISTQTGKENIDSMRRDFKQNRSGKNLFTVNGKKNMIGYSHVHGTDGWMLAVTDENSVIMSPINKILVMSCILFFILILEFLVTSVYLIHIKEINLKTNLLRKEEIKYFTYVDTLTKIPNRKGIKKNSEDWFNYCRNNKINGSIFILDIDNFESVNNTFNHSVGDKFLSEVSDRLSNIISERDIIGRIGGDEFAIFISNIHSADEVKHFANFLLCIFKKPFIIDGNAIHLSCSIGIIPFDFKDKKTEDECDEIINRGEFVMHKAKSLIKGSYLIFNSELNNKFNFQRNMEHELKMSILNDELTCYYQPQYSDEVKGIVGFEALARWNSSKFGMVSPEVFISIAEKTGFINDLGRFIVDKTFAFAKSIEGQNICVSFNVSPIELLQSDFTDYIINKFNDYKLKPKSVAIEVTESCLIESFDDVIKKLHTLKNHGIFVSLDDFGTGFSSLTYLKNLPINLVKIDKSFIDEIVTDNVEKDIVDMIINLAHKLNLEVIAEGVENEEQIEIVSKCGCRIIQGYYISPPVPESKARSLLDVLHK